MGTQSGFTWFLRLDESISINFDTNILNQLLNLITFFLLILNKWQRLWHLKLALFLIPKNKKKLLSWKEELMVNSNIVLKLNIVADIKLTTIRWR